VVSSTGGKIDVKSSLREPIGQLYNDARWILDLSTRSGQGAIGLGGFKYVLAPEMVPSLIKTAVVDMTAELGATPHPEPEIPALGQDAGDDNADYSLYPHYFTHTYPGTTGCEATCESDDIDEATCSGKFECEWYDEKCWSRVGREACPESPEALDAFLANVINPRRRRRAPGGRVQHAVRARNGKRVPRRQPVHLDRRRVLPRVRRALLNARKRRPCTYLLLESRVDISS
jgi:hypothetical protein